MAVTIGISFLLVIPIEPVYWLLTPFAGLLIGYYANQRAMTPRGAWRRILVNALYAGLVTGLTLALLLLAVKALFFYADTGYPDFNRVEPATQQAIPPCCETGADCVRARYIAAGRGAALEAAGRHGRRLVQLAVLAAAAEHGRAAARRRPSAAAAVGGAVYGVTRPTAGRGAGRDSPESERPGDRRGVESADGPERAGRYFAAGFLAGALARRLAAAALAAGLAVVAFAFAGAFVGLGGRLRRRRDGRRLGGCARRWPRPRRGRSCSGRPGPCRPRSGHPWPCRPCRARSGTWPPSPRRPCRSSSSPWCRSGRWRHRGPR